MEAYLPKCVESVLGQGFRDLELILVDDGSPDGSGALCDRYGEQDPRVRVIHRENGGAAAARNTGLSAAVGEYLTFLDGDDWWVDGCLEKIAGLLDGNGPDLVAGRALVYREEDGSTVEDPVYRDMPPTPARWEDAFAYLTGTFNCVPWRYFIRRRLLTEHRVFFEEGLHHEDELWTPLMLARTRSIAFYQPPYYTYRMDRPGSLSQADHSRSVRSLARMSAVLAEKSRDKTLPEPARNFLATRSAKLVVNALVHYGRTEKPQRVPELRAVLEGVLPNLGESGEQGPRLARRLTALCGVNRASQLLAAAYRVRVGK